MPTKLYAGPDYDAYVLTGDEEVQVLIALGGGAYKVYKATAQDIADLGGGGSGSVTSVGYSFGATLTDVFSIAGSPITTSGTLTASAVDGGADVLLFWDDSAGKITYLTLGTNLSITGTTLNASGGGGLTNWTDGLNTSAPNATVPVASFTATNAATNVDAAILPKGTGSSLAAIPDGTSAGGNKRGTNATDWQTARSAANQVASGQYSSISGGFSNIATGQSASVAGGSTNSANQTGAAIAGGTSNTITGAQGVIAGGQSNSVSAAHAAILGGQSNIASAVHASVGGGQGNQATGTHSHVGGGEFNFAGGVYSYCPGGYYATARSLYGVGVRASGRFSATGDAQDMCSVARVATTNATPAAITNDGAAASSTNQLILPNNSLYAFKAIVVVRENATGDSAAWEVTGAVKRGANAASTALLGTPTAISIGADAGAATWTVGVTADTTNGGIRFTATGEAAHNLRWVTDVYSCAQVVG